MTTSTVSFIVAMTPILLLTEQNLRKIRGYIIPSRIDIHCEIQAVPFAQLFKMQPGEPSSAIHERVIRARNIQTERFSHLPQGGGRKRTRIHCRSAQKDAFIVKRRKNLDRGDSCVPSLARHSSSLTPDLTPSYNSRLNSKSFKDLECWQKAHEFALAVYRITKQFPEEERYGLTSQFRRAAVSIAANICEGYKKLLKADKLRFMNIAQGSLEECRYYIILSRDIEYIDQPTHDSLEYLINGASWKLNGYVDGISKNAGIKD